MECNSVGAVVGFTLYVVLFLVAPRFVGMLSAPKLGTDTSSDIAGTGSLG